MIENLQPGRAYYARSMAIHSLGAGPAAISSPASVAPPKQPPMAPVSPFSDAVSPLLKRVSQSRLQVLLRSNVFDGGDEVT